MRALFQLFFVLLFAAGFVHADLPDDLDALRLADTAPRQVAVASDWQWFAEAAVGQSYLRKPEDTAFNQRLSVELQFDQRFAPGWRVVLANRLDLVRQDKGTAPAIRNEVNTLKELYLSRQVSENHLVDLGRINAYQGLASGYNPTDFFRPGSVRSLVSIEPGSLKKNRLGSVMLRSQHLWNDGAFTALVSPKLASQANVASFDPDWGASNNQNRWMLAFSHKIADGIDPQWIIFDKENQSPQLGLNLSTALGDSTVVYLEWSGGRSRSLLSQAQVLKGNDDTAFRQHLASGINYTDASKWSVIVELEYNGAAPDSSQWDGLRHGSPVVYGRYRSMQLEAQELATKKEVFFYLTWPDALVRHMDINALLKHNLADNSRLTWVEARYHLDKVDLALQLQRSSGDPTSAYGASTQKRSVQALLRYYF